MCNSHFVSMICSSSWAFLQSSSAGGKLFPTFMKSAAILLLRRNPAARRFSPWRTQASTAAAWTEVRGWKIYFLFDEQKDKVHKMHQKQHHREKTTDLSTKRKFSNVFVPGGIVKPNLLHPHDFCFCSVNSRISRSLNEFSGSHLLS